MNRCEKVRSLLALSAGGDLEAKESQVVSRHLSECDACREEQAAFSRLMGAARAVSRDDLRLHPATRARIVREASAHAVRRPRFWGVPLAILQVPHRPAMFAAAAGLLVALATLPVLLHDRSGTAGRKGDGVTKIQVVSENGFVTLAWSNGHKNSYTVYKSSDPRDSSRAEAHTVRGNIWTDTEPDRSPVVFYRVE